MRVLDLFSGVRGWSDAWASRGHEVVTLDADPSFGADLVMRVEDASVAAVSGAFGGAGPDVVLASPPCERFSVMTIHTNWWPDQSPRTVRAKRALGIVRSTLELIEALDPRFFVVENPVDMLRSLDTGLLALERHQVNYCRYGESYQKPTDLWGGFPPSWRGRPICGRNARGKVIWDCHAWTPRGDRRHGVQSGSRVSPARRARVPRELALELCLAAEEGERVDKTWRDRIPRPQARLPKPGRRRP